VDNPRNPGLIGRDDVLAQLVRAVEELAGGRGGLVLLTGEAGIGKSAVVAAGGGHGPGSWRAGGVGLGLAGEEKPPYWPWVQVFRSLVAAGGRPPPGLAAGASSLARLLPELPGTADGPAAGDELTAVARFRLLDEFTTDLAAFGPPTPEQQALFGALEGRPDEIGRFLGVLTGAVPMADYFRPRSLLRVLGIRGLATMALRGRRPAAVG
jgi:hypothetical protein